MPKILSRNFGDVYDSSMGVDTCLVAHWNPSSTMVPDSFLNLYFGIFVKDSHKLSPNRISKVPSACLHVTLPLNHSSIPSLLVTLTFTR